MNSNYKIMLKINALSLFIVFYAYIYIFFYYSVGDVIVIFPIFI